MHRIREAVRELVAVFRNASSKHAANEAAGPLLAQLTRHPAFFTAVLERYLEKPGSLNRGNYPVVGIEIASTPWFGFVANCWIPLPGRETHISTKAIHHHGNMLLTTATMFGAGYEHWMFSQPRERDRERGLWDMDLLEAAPHPHRHVSFVDAWIAHTPFYPRELSVTLALWSNRFETTWRDRLKRLPGISENSAALRKVALGLGLRKTLDLKVVESFDFYPTAEGFKVMTERKEFPLGPAHDHLRSVFHVLQQTGNEHLGRVVQRHLERGAIAAGNVEVVRRLLDDLRRDRPIEGKLSESHTGVPYANFTREDVFTALRASGKRVDHGGQLAPSSSGEAGARASAH